MAFPDYWHGWVHYCSSDFWSGTRKTAGYHFRGKQILNAVVGDLLENFDLKSADQIVLSGCTAGASGVTFNCDSFSESILAASPDVDVRCIADGPDFYSTEVPAPDCGANNPDWRNGVAQFFGTVFDRSCIKHVIDNSLDNVAAECGMAARY